MSKRLRNIFDNDILDFQLKEIENDLIASFSIKNNIPPKYQFMNLKLEVTWKKPNSGK